MPSGLLNNCTDLLICPTCTAEFIKTHYKSKFCSKTCYHKDMYRRDRNRQLNKGYVLRKAYGISLDEYKLLQQEQDFKCKICAETPPILYVDHCHAYKHVRGLLCRTCNLLLGHAKDSINILTKSIEYLRQDYLKTQRGVK